jgi:N-acetylmuramic acid 6-phosphate etherase
MVRLGHTYAGLMTGVVAKNAKLHGRTVLILAEASGRDLDTCARVLDDSGQDLKVALVRLLGDVDADRARTALDSADGVVRRALRLLASPTIEVGEEG